MTGITFCEKSIWSCKAASSSLHPYEQCASSEVHPCTRGTLYIPVKNLHLGSICSIVHLDTWNHVDANVFFGSIIEYPFFKSKCKNGIEEDENENDDDNDVLRNHADDINNHQKNNDCGQLKKERNLYPLKANDAHFGKLHSRVSVVFTEVTGTH